MPLIKSTAHFAHDAVTKHTWNPNNDTVRYEAAGSGTYKKDMFAFGDTADVPHKSEHTHQLSDPQEWAGRICNMTLVHTGGNTNMAMYTHHTRTRPMFPPGSIRMGTFTLSQYLPKEDAAVQELHMVADKVRPVLPELVQALEGYHLHSPDGWVTTAGFMACANKAGLSLLRSEYLALERSVPKDTMGRINFYHVAQVVDAVGADNEVDEKTSTAPEAVLRMTGQLTGSL